MSCLLTNAEPLAAASSISGSLPVLRAIEFYSGIGGMHFALKRTSCPVNVIAAFDINTSANGIYRHNFPGVNLCQNNIEAISCADLDGKLCADLWTMSPPCQPFTRKGLQLDVKDERCESLMVLLDKLKQLLHPPRYVFVENVVGFEVSEAHLELVTCLRSLNYEIEEFILSPMQFGIPNTRPRYYMLARRCADSDSDDILQNETGQEICKRHARASDTIRPISEFLDIHLNLDGNNKKLKVTRETLVKYGPAIDVICPESTRSACFTKSYGNYIAGCGSYFVRDSSEIIGNRLRAFETKTTKADLEQDCDEKAATYEDEDFRTYVNMTLPEVRRLSPREIANLMCFPSDFSWPENTTDKQLYKTLGNSVNVYVVSILLNDLLRRNSVR